MKRGKDEQECSLKDLSDIEILLLTRQEGVVIDSLCDGDLQMFHQQSNNKMNPILEIPSSNFWRIFEMNYYFCAYSVNSGGQSLIPFTF